MPLAKLLVKSAPKAKPSLLAILSRVFKVLQSMAFVDNNREFTSRLLLGSLFFATAAADND